MSIAESLEEFIAPSAELELVATGFKFTEGPVWMPDGSLLFSDIPANRLMRWHPVDSTSIVREPNNKGNGMTLDNEGRLVVCEHATSRVVVGAPGGDTVVVASQWSGKELNSPNDVIVASDGSVIFSDPSFGRTMDTVGVVREIPQDIQGVYRARPGEASLELLVADCGQPNGLCLSPDESVLYVGDTAMAHIRAFAMDPSGAIGPDRVFASGITASPAADDGCVDGMKVDELGNVYVTGPGGIWIYSPRGKHLGVINVPEQPANFNWGGKDWDVLYVTARTSVYRIQLRVSGNPLSYMT